MRRRLRRQNSGRRRRRSRREAEEMIARLLTFDVSCLTPREMVAARLAAHLQGVELADCVHEARVEGDPDEQDACGDLKDYRRSVVRWAHMDIGVISSLDAELWRHMPLSDPRLIAFRSGYEQRMRELEG